MPAASWRSAPTSASLRAPAHPYTLGLIARVPTPTRRGAAAGDRRLTARAGAACRPAAVSPRAATLASPPAPSAAAVAAGRRRPCQRMPARRSWSRHEHAAPAGGAMTGAHLPLRAASAGVLERRFATDGPGASTASTLRCASAARRSGWSARAAAASRPSARALVRLIEADGGQIRFDGEDVRAFRGEALRRYNRRVADGVPGPVRLAQSAHDRRRDPGRGAARHGICRRRGARRASPNCWTSCGCPPALAAR